MMEPAEQSAGTVAIPSVEGDLYRKAKRIVGGSSKPEAARSNATRWRANNMCIPHASPWRFLTNHRGAP